MKLIAHRGNINGKTSYENHPDYIKEAITEGFDVEIDVWVKGRDIYLGHDEPEYTTSFGFLSEHKDNLWCHAKNYEALSYLNMYRLHAFWHENDSFTLTNQGVIWQYPDNEYYKDSIFLMPELFDVDIDESKLKMVKGICSDYILKYKNLI